LKMAERWVTFADEKLAGTGMKCFVCPGNDDMFELDDVLASSKSITMAEGKILDLDGTTTCSAAAGQTPLPGIHTGNAAKKSLRKKLRPWLRKLPISTAASLTCTHHHFGSGLDEAPELDENLRPKYAGRSLIPVGSTAVRDAINKYQPPLALTGHIHEGRGIKRMKNLCSQPGQFLRTEHPARRNYRDGQKRGQEVRFDLG
jgi:uncharacterized protein